MPRSRVIHFGDPGVYVGKRGELHAASSESDQLTEAIALITHGDYREALDTLKALREQVAKGYHANPYTPFKIVGVLGRAVHTIRYQHAKDRKYYEHDFQGDNAQVVAVERNGKRDLLITSEKGLPLWDEF